MRPKEKDLLDPYRARSKEVFLMSHHHHKHHHHAPKCAMKDCKRKPCRCRRAFIGLLALAAALIVLVCLLAAMCHPLPSPAQTDEYIEYTSYDAAPITAVSPPEETTLPDTGGIRVS
jgi:hypothetical protein